MAELPILPLKIAPIIADCTHMTTLEFGAYCKILFAMWGHGGTLPDVEEELALIAGVSLPVWRRIAEKVRRPMEVTGGKLSQKRLTDTWIEVQDKRRKRAGAANVRWINKRRA